VEKPWTQWQGQLLELQAVDACGRWAWEEALLAAAHFQIEVEPVQELQVLQEQQLPQLQQLQPLPFGPETSGALHGCQQVVANE
jgi:hypothetical protein